MVSPNAAPVYSKISAVFDQYREAEVTPFGGHSFCGNVTVSWLYLYAGSGCSLGLFSSGHLWIVGLSGIAQVSFLYL